MNTVKTSKHPFVGAIVLAFISDGTLTEDKQQRMFRPILAHVLSVNDTLQDELGTEGEPIISLAYLDIRDGRQMGRPDWHEQFVRLVGVHHGSHENMQKGNESVFYATTFPTAATIAASGAGGYFDMDSAGYFKESDLKELFAEEVDDELNAPFKQLIDEPKVPYKTSGDGGDAGDWTQAGNGLDYPNHKGTDIGGADDPQGLRQNVQVDDGKPDQERRSEQQPDDTDDKPVPEEDLEQNRDKKDGGGVV